MHHRIEIMWLYVCTNFEFQIYIRTVVKKRGKLMKDSIKLQPYDEKIIMMKDEMYIRRATKRRAAAATESHIYETLNITWNINEHQLFINRKLSNVNNDWWLPIPDAGNKRVFWIERDTRSLLNEHRKG